MTEHQRDSAEIAWGVEPQGEGSAISDRAAAGRQNSSNGSLAGRVFECYRRQLHRFLVRRIRNPQDVDDLAQTVYERLMKIDDERPIQKPLAYIYTVASHVLADHRRQVAAHRGEYVIFDSDFVDELAEEPSCVSADDLADGLNLQQQIDNALSQLPPTHAAVLLAHKRDGLSYVEVAQKLGLSPHTVEKYVTQAKARIRALSWER